MRNTVAHVEQYLLILPEHLRSSACFGQKYVLGIFRKNTGCDILRYQPFRFWSHKLSQCVFVKSRCNELGQIMYDHGEVFDDSVCRCDHTQGYAHVYPTREKCHCKPSVEDCTCYKKTCPSNHILTLDYECKTSLSRNSSCNYIKPPPYRKKSTTGLLNGKDTNHFTTTRAAYKFKILCTIFIMLEPEDKENERTSSKESSITGSMQTETVVYIICSSAVTFVLTLCLVALNRYRRKHNRNLNKQHVVVVDNIENISVSSHQEQDQYERVYDTIDESKMIDLPGQDQIPAAESSNVSSVKDDCIPYDGYLNPYQPIVPDPDIHDYLTAKCFDEHDMHDTLKHSDQNQDQDNLCRPPSTNEQELHEMSTSEKISPPSLFPDM